MLRECANGDDENGIGLDWDGPEMEFGGALAARGGFTSSNGDSET